MDNNDLERYKGGGILLLETMIFIFQSSNYYDQWENGYDPDIANPSNLYSAENPGGTQIWGDGDPANGAPPGFPEDIINAGNVIILNNSFELLP